MTEKIKKMNEKNKKALDNVLDGNEVVTKKIHVIRNTGNVFIVKIEGYREFKMFWSKFQSDEECLFDLFFRCDGAKYNSFVCFDTGEITLIKGSIDKEVDYNIPDKIKEFAISKKATKDINETEVVKRLKEINSKRYESDKKVAVKKDLYGFVENDSPKDYSDIKDSGKRVDVMILDFFNNNQVEKEKGRGKRRKK